MVKTEISNGFAEMQHCLINPKSSEVARCDSATALSQCYLGGETPTTPLREHRAACINEALKSLTEAIKLVPDESQSLINLLGAAVSLLQGPPDAHQMERTLGKLNGAVKATGDLDREASNIIDHLKQAQDRLGTLKALQDFPLISADGIMRDRVFTMTPEQFTTYRKQRYREPEVCDVCVIGGGPAGVAIATHLGAANIDTVLFEGGYLFQAFSDGRAHPIHTMRTDESSSSMFPPTLATQDDIGLVSSNVLRNVLDRKRLRAISEQACGVSGKLKYTDDPLSRTELYAYLQYVGAKLHASGGTILEQAPITKIENLENGLIKVTSALGHSIRAKKLAVCVGFVGTEGEFGRMPEIFEEFAQRHCENLVVVNDEHDLAANVKAASASPNQLIVSDAMLGNSEIETAIQDLVPGTEVAVVGGGEGAAKSVTHIARSNPEVIVNLFTSSPIVYSDLQIPDLGLGGQAPLRAAIEPHYRAALEAAQEVFGTPVTPESMAEILNLVGEGRVRVFELGARFDKETIDLKQVEDGIEVRIAPGREDVLVNLSRQRNEFTKAGLAGSPGAPSPLAMHKPLVTLDGPIIVAAGYDRAQLNRSHPLLQQLVDAKLVAIDPERGIELEEDGLQSRLDSRVHFVGGVKPGDPTETSILGIGVKAKIAAESLSNPTNYSSSRDNLFQKMNRSFENTYLEDASLHSSQEDGINTHLLRIRALERQAKGKSPRSSGGIHITRRPHVVDEQPEPVRTIMINRGLDLTTRLARSVQHSRKVVLEEAHRAKKDGIVKWFQGLFKSN